LHVIVKAFKNEELHFLWSFLSSKQKMATAVQKRGGVSETTNLKLISSLQVWMYEKNYFSMIEVKQTYKQWI
jgi:hypothetical protein